MTSAAHGSPRLACCRVAGRRRAARCWRLRREIERHAFKIELAQLAQHGIHRRRCARAGQILLRRRDEIARLLTGEVGCAGGLAVAVLAVAVRAGCRHLLAVLITREDGSLCRRDRRQTGVVAATARVSSSLKSFAIARKAAWTRLPSLYSCNAAMI